VNIVAFTGGVGGAKLADGFNQIMLPEDLTIVVNTGDDFVHCGLKICPDLDTVCYTLAGLANPVTGWGRVEETWNVMDSVTQIGGPGWFRLGDRDLGTHLERTRRLISGDSLSEITSDFCGAWGIGPAIFPMSDDETPTMVLLEEGELPFQEYFVHQKCKPKVTGFRFEGIDKSNTPEGVTAAIHQADVVVICPSNPLVSIDPILAVPGIKEALITRLDSSNPIPLKMIAVSPIIAGKAVKGPVVKMYQELGIEPSALSVAKHYGDLIQGFVFDQVDVGDEPEIQRLGLQTLVTDTLMMSSQDRKRLAKEIMVFCKQLLSDKI
jgi:LPPG:FO 2-phospho-L-lactate transferase